MNKKIFTIGFAIIIITILIVPVMAIGPQNAKNNDQTVYPTPFSVQLTTPSGMFHEWMQEPVGPLKIDRKDASEFTVGNAIDGTELTFPFDLISNQNRWIYLTQTEYYNLLLSLGIPDDHALGAVTPFTEGVYYKVNYIGS